MNKFKKTIGACSLGLAISIGLAACAATPTQESSGQYVDSSVITSKVKAALLNAPDLNSASISVETYKSTVQLSGFVNSSDQSNLAEKTTAAVPGVTSVKNDLVVKTSAN